MSLQTAPTVLRCAEGVAAICQEPILRDITHWQPHAFSFPPRLSGERGRWLRGGGPVVDRESNHFPPARAVESRSDPRNMQSALVALVVAVHRRPEAHRLQTLIDRQLRRRGLAFG